MSKVLIIDDEERLRSLLARIIRLEGWPVSECGTLKQAARLLEKEEPDVILCDVKLPDGNGIDFVKQIRQDHRDTEIILLTAYGNIPDGIQAMKNGAFDYLVKGNDNDKVIPLISRALEKSALKKRVAALEKRVGRKYDLDSIIGHSPAIRQAVELAKKVAATDATVLLLGETGTGKEVFAEAIHGAGKRSGFPFVALNCSAFSRDILESELFGYRAGAFTGALKDKKGLIEEAHLGTLFLDEIAEMPYELQAKLLRVLETSEFIKVGDTVSTRIDVRFIAATNRDLHAETEKNRFREDLFYRLNVFTISLPALRDRREDVPELARFFLDLFAGRFNRNIAGMDEGFLQVLAQHDWKGNIRELKNIVERAVIISSGPQLTTADLPIELRPGHAAVRDAPALDLQTVEKMHIRKILLATHGNKTEAARLLNIGLTTLYRKIDEYGL